MNIEVAIKNEWLTVLINDLPHLQMRFKEVLGYQSWEESEDSFFIEFCLKHKNIISEYDNRDKWATILRLLNEKVNP